eukprot:gene27154-33418_t
MSIHLVVCTLHRRVYHNAEAVSDAESLDPPSIESASVDPVARLPPVEDGAGVSTRGLGGVDAGGETLGCTGDSVVGAAVDETGPLGSALGEVVGEGEMGADGERVEAWRVGEAVTGMGERVVEMAGTMDGRLVIKPVVLGMAVTGKADRLGVAVEISGDVVGDNVGLMLGAETDGEIVEEAFGTLAGAEVSGGLARTVGLLVGVSVEGGVAVAVGVVVGAVRVIWAALGAFLRAVRQLERRDRGARHLRHIIPSAAGASCSPASVIVAVLALVAVLVAVEPSAVVLRGGLVAALPVHPKEPSPHPRHVSTRLAPTFEWMASMVKAVAFAELLALANVVMNSKIDGCIMHESSLGSNVMTPSAVITMS